MCYSVRRDFFYYYFTDLTHSPALFWCFFLALWVMILIHRQLQVELWKDAIQTQTPQLDSGQIAPNT